jgi:hypothetical protein
MLSVWQVERVEHVHSDEQRCYWSVDRRTYCSVDAARKVCQPSSSRCPLVPKPRPTTCHWRQRKRVDAYSIFIIEPLSSCASVVTGEKQPRIAAPPSPPPRAQIAATSGWELVEATASEGLSRPFFPFPCYRVSHEIQCLRRQGRRSSLPPMAV